MTLAGGLEIAVARGLFCAFLHVIGPDHLATLITLSTLLQPLEACQVGAAWGMGHSIGMVVIAALFIAAHGIFKDRIQIEDWEHYGNYMIGVSMMVTGFYFMVSYSQFLEEQKDGSFNAKCSCYFRAPSLDASRRRSTKPAARLGQRGSKFIKDPKMVGEDADDEAASHSIFNGALQAYGTENVAPRPEGRDFQGLILGVLQGLCCPAGLVGIGFLMAFSVKEILLFLFVFVLASVAGTAALSCAWACLSHRGLASQLSPRVLYFSSCLFTFALGAVWIVANYFGVLGKIDFAEHGQLDDLPRK